MKLPNNEIGISDILAWRECPRRMSFAMGRHTEGEHPEAVTRATVYGSAVHEAIAYAESEDAGNAEAIGYAFERYGEWLEPEDLARMKADMKTYRERLVVGVRTVGVELEARIPLLEWEGETIYFRGKLDRLEQSRDDPSVFYHRDYKSSRWPKTRAEVQNDPQMWAYNLLIHEFFPECEKLVQTYDQLNFGEITTSKTEQERELIREWLVHEVRAILADEPSTADGLLSPKLNDWCEWCPVAESCPLIDRLTEYAKVRIAALAPERKEGRKTVVDLDPDLVEEYAERLTEVSKAMGLLGRFEKSVKSMLMEMSEAERRDLGYESRQRSVSVIPPDALAVAHRLLGERFYDLINLPKSALDEIPDPELRTLLEEVSERRAASAYVQRRR